MNPYEPKTFNIPTIDGISDRAVAVHLGLYEGYVKNLNAHYTAIQGSKDNETVSALTRRISFELAGVVNHERYFGALEGGPTPIPNGALKTCVEKTFGSFDTFIKCIKHETAIMRGIGWVVVAYDQTRDQIHMLWVSDHELGNVNLPSVLSLDMWEHSYMVDYEPKDKGKYVDAYLNAVNWETVASTFDTFKS